MKILHVNHRDLGHPKAGGLESVVHEVSRRWVKQGHEVTLVCSGFKGGRTEEVLNGVRVVRHGREEWFNFTVGWWLKQRQWFGVDVVIEHLSKVACFLPLFFRTPPLVGHVPHIFGKAIFNEVSWPIGVYVYGMERLLPLGYSKVPIWAMSQSTSQELQRIGFHKEKIEVILNGVDRKGHADKSLLSSVPLVLYVGRVRKYKGLADPLLPAWKQVLSKRPDARLKIIGKGDYEPNLKEEIKRMNLSDSVEMLGFVSEEEKIRWMNSAWLMVYPSAKEGWGLPVIEAAILGVPTVASDSPGLKESVRDGETGVLVPHGHVDKLAGSILDLLNDDRKRKEMGEKAQKWSENFNWDTMSEQVLNFIFNKVPHLNRSC